MQTQFELEAAVRSDGKTVWVHARDGSCVGRFSAFGIDIHRTVSDQMKGMSECLDCSHAVPEMAEWDRFKAGMLKHYDVVVSDDHRPVFLTAKNRSGTARLMDLLQRQSCPATN